MRTSQCKSEACVYVRAEWNLIIIIPDAGYRDFFDARNTLNIKGLTRDFDSLINLDDFYARCRPVL